MPLPLTIEGKEAAAFGLDLNNKTSKRVIDAFQQFGDIRIPVALGMVDGVTVDSFIGTNESFATASSQDIIFNGGDYEFLTTAQTLFVSSTDNTSDNATGVGCRAVIIFGLDENYLAISEVVAMDGSTNVSTVNTYKRINNFFVVDAGSDGDNAGDITLTDSLTQSIEVSFIGRNHLGDGLRRALNFIYTIPEGKVGILNQLTGSISRSGGSSAVKEASSAIEIRFHNSTVFTPIGGVASRSDGSSVNTTDLNYPAALPSKTDIRGRTVSLTNSTTVTLTASLLLIDKTTFGLS
jgi:hypothetical protein